MASIKTDINGPVLKRVIAMPIGMKRLELIKILIAKVLKTALLKTNSKSKYCIIYFTD